MPISKDNWNRGWAADSLEERVLNFLRANPDLAYTAEEIGQAVEAPGFGGPPSSAVQAAARGHAVPDLEGRLVALAISGSLEFRYITNHGRTAGNAYYRVRSEA